MILDEQYKSIVLIGRRLRSVNKNNLILYYLNGNNVTHHSDKGLNK